MCLSRYRRVGLCVDVDAAVLGSREWGLHDGSNVDRLIEQNRCVDGSHNTSAMTAGRKTRQSSRRLRRRRWSLARLTYSGYIRRLSCSDSVQPFRRLSVSSVLYTPITNRNPNPSWVPLSYSQVSMRTRWRFDELIVPFSTSYVAPVCVRSIAMNVGVCLSVCLIICLYVCQSTAISQKPHDKLHKIFCTC